MGLFRKDVIPKLMLLPLILSLTGCVYMIVGGAGALGGYVVSPDTVEGLTKSTQEEVWDSAIEIISVMGTINEELHEGGVILARVSGAKVTVTVSPVNKSTVKLTIKARKAFLPKINVAQDVFVKIMSRLSE